MNSEGEWSRRISDLLQESLGDAVAIWANPSGGNFQISSESLIDHQNKAMTDRAMQGQPLSNTARWGTCSHNKTLPHVNACRREKLQTTMQRWWDMGNPNWFSVHGQRSRSLCTTTSQGLIVTMLCPHASMNTYSPPLLRTINPQRRWASPPDSQWTRQRRKKAHRCLKLPVKADKMQWIRGRICKINIGEGTIRRKRTPYTQSRSCPESNPSTNLLLLQLFRD